MTTNARTIFSAAEEGDAAAVARLLASGASADERTAEGGETPLMRAAARGHEEVVRLLLDAGADVCARRADGFTPLILAAFFGHEAVVRLLVERGADTDARTNLGTTAARWAEARGFALMAKVLRAAEASKPRVVAVAQTLEKNSKRKAADEVGIFSKGRGRGEESLEDPVAPAPEVEANGLSVSARRGGQIPTHPSASTFRLGHFLRSWQGSLGALLLLAAVGVAVFAYVRGGNAPRHAAAQPTPAPSAPQATAQQTPATMLPTAEPSPAFPTPDAQGVMPVTEQGYPVPSTTGQPLYVTTSPVAPAAASNAPGELTVVSESGGTSTQDAGQSGRRNNANTKAPARNDNAPDAPRATRTPDPEPQRPAPPASSPNQTPPPAPPQPTPGRAKVIQWPPQ